MKNQKSLLLQEIQASIKKTKDLQAEINENL